MSLKIWCVATAVAALSSVSFGFVNGDFEGGGTGWAGYAATPTYMAGSRTNGAGSIIASVSNGSASGGSFYQTGIGEISANGQNWQTKAWLRWNSGSGSISFGFWGTASPFGDGSTNVVIPSSATSWQEYTVTKSWNSVDYADGYKDVQFSWLNPSSLGAVVQMDDVSLAPVSGINDWALY